MTVAYQGEPGAFSEAAAADLFRGAVARGLPTFHAVFEAVASGEARRGVVPVENCIHGSVPEVLDALDAFAQKQSVTVLRDHWHPVELMLMAGKGTSLDTVREVRSHTQALGQSGAWLDEHRPEAVRIATPDTAGAARFLAEHPSPGIAVIAGRHAAERYGLDVIAEHLEGSIRNHTRFLVLAPASVEPEGANRTLLVMTPSEASPNALFRALTTFVGRRLGVSRIEPRPVRGVPGRRHYHVEVEGAGEALDSALTDAAAFCERLTVVGSFTASPLP